MDNFYIQWHITNLCNLHCKHCYQEIFSSREDLPLEKLKLITENLIDASHQWNKKVHITLTGGEPLLKKETFPLLEYLDSKNEITELSLITNGLFLSEKICNQLEELSKLKNIKISLDGANKKTNDAIRGKENFQQVLNSIEIAKKISDFKIILMFTLMKSNFEELNGIVTLCKDFKLDGLIIERFIPLGQSISIKEEVLDRDKWKAIVETLINLCKIDCGLNDLLSYRAFQIEFNSNSEPNLLGAPCTVGIDGVCIMPDGSVFPCRRFNLSIGNLQEQPLTKIWQNSEPLNKIREKDKLQGRCGVCSIKECQGCRALAYALTGDYLAEDSQCWYYPIIDV